MSEPERVEQSAAELRVVRGAQDRQLRMNPGAALRLTVGSDPAAGLRFEGRGIAPLHFELVWDGTHLWLQDTLRLGRTRVNNRPLNDWWVVLGQALVSFGTASLALAAEGTLPQRRGPDFAALERARLVEQPQLRRRDTVRMSRPDGFISAKGRL